MLILRCVHEEKIRLKRSDNWQPFKKCFCFLFCADISTEAKVTKQWSGNVEISTVSVKADKFQKLRRITEKIQKSDDIIISSKGSSPATSPRPENLTALSNPVDPSDLYAQLTALTFEEDKENVALESGNENSKVEADKGENISKDGAKGTNQPSMDNNMNFPICTEEFYAVSGTLHCYFCALRGGCYYKPYIN